MPEAERLKLAGQLPDALTDEPSEDEPRGEAYLKEIQRRTRESDPSTWLRVQDVIRRVNAKHEAAYEGIVCRVTPDEIDVVGMPHNRQQGADWGSRG